MNLMRVVSSGTDEGKRGASRKGMEEKAVAFRRHPSGCQDGEGARRRANQCGVLLTHAFLPNRRRALRLFARPTPRFRARRPYARLSDPSQKWPLAMPESRKECFTWNNPIANAQRNIPSSGGSEIQRWPDFKRRDGTASEVRSLPLASARALRVVPQLRDKLSRSRSIRLTRGAGSLRMTFSMGAPAPPCVPAVLVLSQ
jgi:hypothetical protein